MHARCVTTQRPSQSRNVGWHLTHASRPHRIGSRRIYLFSELNDSIARAYRAKGGAQHVPDLHLSFLPQRIPHGRVSVCNSDTLSSSASFRMLLDDVGIETRKGYTRRQQRQHESLPPQVRPLSAVP